MFNTIPLEFGWSKTIMLLAQNTEEKNTGTESINITVVYLSSNAKKFCKIVKLPMNVATYGYRAFNRLQGRKQKPKNHSDIH